MKLRSILVLLIPAFALIACATTPKADEKPVNQAPIPVASAPAAAATDHIETAAQSAAEKNLSSEYSVFDSPAMKAAEASRTKKSEAKPPAAASDAPNDAQPPTEEAKITLIPAKKAHGFEAKKSLSWLEHGNRRFVKGGLRRDGQSRKDIVRVALAQNPHAIVLASSDSRVPPELIFDQKLGEIFVVRTAGEALDRSAIGSIEYALKNFNAKLVVILGNTGAGKELWARPDAIAEDLKHVSPAIHDAVEHDGVLLAPAVYDLNSGEVKFQ